MVPDVFRIRSVKRETGDCFTLVLDTKDGPFNFQPGQFNMLYMYGVGEIPISISSAHKPREPLMHTLRAVGAVTGAMKNLKRGDSIAVRGPYGTAWPLHEAEGRDLVFIAGGIGLSPLRPAIKAVLHQRDRYGKVAIVYGTRTPDDILHQKDLERWSGRLDISVNVTVDYAAGHWHGNVGVVTQLIPRAPFDPANAVCFLCGPEIMMRFSVQELIKRGVDPDHIFLSMERNMKCGVGFCGHCQYGPHFICKDGPVFRYPEIQPLFTKSEI